MNADQLLAELRARHISIEGRGGSLHLEAPIRCAHAGAQGRRCRTQLVTQLREDGAQVVPIGQGFASLNAPARELEKLVAGRELRHNGHPVPSWMVGNAVVRQDPAGNIKPDRERSADKIDGVVALVMALARAIVSEPPREVSVLFI